MLRYNLKDQTCQVGVVKHTCYRTKTRAEARTMNPEVSPKQERMAIKRKIGLDISLQCSLSFLLWHCHLDLGHTSVTLKNPEKLSCGLSTWRPLGSLVYLEPGPWHTLGGVWGPGSSRVSPRCVVDRQEGGCEHKRGTRRSTTRQPAQLLRPPPP